MKFWVTRAVLFPITNLLQKHSDARLHHNFLPPFFYFGFTPLQENWVNLPWGNCEANSKHHVPGSHLPNSATVSIK